MKSRYLTVIAIGLMLLITACSKNNMSELEMPTSGNAADKPTLELRVETSGSTATIFIDTNMKLAKNHVGMGRISGEGHVHLYLDDGEKEIITTNKYMTGKLAPGTHVVKISLHNNDHTPYDVSDQIEFEIK
jgi:hypothetical protein